ncbi:MAG: hypothetical protein H7833_14590 [Magnetococcus sp. DMHC-1]|nr:hypothetical protein [Magnetococcales bacterium]
MDLQNHFNLIHLNSDISTPQRLNSYAVTRHRLTQQLVQYTLVDSYLKFQRYKQPYPFVAPASLRPGAMGTTKEYKIHNNALIVLMDGEMSEKLRKHFRCRVNNQVNKKNIASLAPGLPALKDYDHAYRLVNHERFEFLLRALMPLDFSLLIQKKATEECKTRQFQLTHFHVKIERLTDSALRSLGIHLNYLKKGLYERGEEFIDEFEKKFFEYFNFYHNAAGRRSAAALASQVMSRDKKTGTVFITSQQDRRLTLLSSNNLNRDIAIEQYLLYVLSEEEMNYLKIWAKQFNINISAHFMVQRLGKKGIFILRVRYEHTDVAMPSIDGSLKFSINQKEKWVRILDKAFVSLNNDVHYAIGYSVPI